MRASAVSTQFIVWATLTPIVFLLLVHEKVSGQEKHTMPHSAGTHVRTVATTTISARSRPDHGVFTYAYSKCDGTGAETKGIP
jgi:hypothetical protein